MSLYTESGKVEIILTTPTDSLVINIILWKFEARYPDARWPDLSLSPNNLNPT